MFQEADLVKAGEKDNKRGEANPEDVDKSKTSPITEPKVNKAVETKNAAAKPVKKTATPAKNFKNFKNAADEASEAAIDSEEDAVVNPLEPEVQSAVKTCKQEEKNEMNPASADKLDTRSAKTAEIEPAKPGEAKVERAPMETTESNEIKRTTLQTEAELEKEEPVPDNRARGDTTKNAPANAAQSQRGSSQETDEVWQLFSRKIDEVSKGSFSCFLSSFSSTGVCSDYISSFYLRHCFITEKNHRCLH